MENPEAFLDFLTIKSMKERYYSDSGKVDTIDTMGTFLTTNDDLESFVRDFTIDDSISDCFADEPDGQTTASQKTVSVSSLRKFDFVDLDSLQKVCFPLNEPQGSNVTPLTHRLTAVEEAARRNRSVALENGNKIQPLTHSQKVVKKPSSTADNTILKGSHHSEVCLQMCKTSQPSTEHLKKESDEHMFPFQSHISNNREAVAKQDKASNGNKHSKFGLKQVWSHTLKKCITKKSSVQNDNGDGPSVDVRKLSGENNNLLHNNASSAKKSDCLIDFDDVYTVKLNVQPFAKSEPVLSSSQAHFGSRMDRVATNIRNEGVALSSLSKSEETISEALAVVDYQVGCQSSQTVSLEGMKANSNVMKLNGPEEVYIGIAAGPAINSVSNPQTLIVHDQQKKHSASLPYSTQANYLDVRSDGTVQHKAEEDSGKRKDAESSSSLGPDLKIGLLDKINEALFQRILATLLKQMRCSSLLTDVLSMFDNGKIVETLSSAVDQLKQLLLLGNIPQDVCRILELMHKNLHCTSSKLSELRMSLEKLNVEMPFNHWPEKFEKDGGNQPRTLLSETYNIIKKQPPDMNDRIQDLLSFHLKSRLEALTFSEMSSVDSQIITQTEGSTHNNAWVSNASGKDSRARPEVDPDEEHPCRKVAKTEGFQDVWLDAQTVIASKGHELKHKSQKALHNGNTQTCQCMGDLPASKAHETGVFADHHHQCRSGRQSNSKSHQTCRHGHRVPEKRSSDHCKHRHQDARRYRRRGKRSASDTRCSRRHTISSFTVSSANTPSTGASTQSVDRHSKRRRASRMFRSSSSSRSSRLFSKDVDEYWSDNESSSGDDDDEDDESYGPVVRLNLDNEDLPDEALRIDRLHRHLESVQKLHQSSEDIIETIITGTGEKLIPHDHFNFETAYSKTQHSELQSSRLAGEHSENLSCAARTQAEAHKPTKMNVFKTKQLAQMFNHEKVTVGNMRELTDSEFEEMFDRRHDITVKRRQQMDSEIPWDQLSFSESDSDEPSTK